MANIIGQQTINQSSFFELDANPLLAATPGVLVGDFCLVDGLAGIWQRVGVADHEFVRIDRQLSLSTQATANGTLTLTNTSNPVLVFTGSTAGQIVKAPSALTLVAGYRLEVSNDSTQSIVVNDGNNGLIANIPAGQRLVAALHGVGSIAGTWTITNTSAITGSPRYAATAGFDGSASSGRWLEFVGNNASNQSPFVVPEASTVKSLSVASNGNATYTITLFKNGVALDTLSVAANSSGTKVGLSHALAAGDKLSAQVTSGSLNLPIFNIFIQVIG